MSEILRFKLNSSYRNPVSIDAEDSFFRGRGVEIKKLKSIINDRTAATVIIGGVRGVGKTSFVREVLRQIKSKEDKEKLIVVDMSFADFGESSDPKSLREKVLKLLIRSLYFSLDEDDKTDDLKSLYDKTYYSELTGTDLIELVKAGENTTKESIITERILKFSVSEEIVNLVKIIITGFLGTGGLWVSALYLKNWLFLVGLIATGYLVLKVLKFDFESKKTKKVENKVLDRASEKVGSSGIAAFDLSADTLEIKLRDVLSKIADSDRKIVFVVDELDKLDDHSEGITEHAVFRIIKPLKNLFSLSNAIFLFIGADDFFDQLEQERTASPYSTSHTLFTDRLFLTSMYYEDINTLIDSYRATECSVGDEDTYKKFKSYISWNAKNHIFDTHNLIDKFTVFDDEDGMHVSVKEDDDLNKGNIQDDWETAAGIQAFVAATFENRKYPGINRLNEKLYLTLHEVGKTLYDAYEIDVKDNDYMGVLSGAQQKKLKIEKLPTDDLENFEGAIEDLLLRMERNGFSDISEVEQEEGVDDNKKLIKLFKYELSNTDFPNESEIRIKNKQLSFEVEFLAELKELEGRKEKLEKGGWDSFEDHLKELARFQKIAKPIKEEGKKREPKSRILNLTKRIRTIKKELQKAVFSELVSKLTEDIEVSNIQISQTDSGQPMWEDDAGISSFYEHLHKEINEDAYKILSHGDRYVLFTLSFGENLQDRYLKIDHLKRRDAKSKVLNIIFGNEIVNKGRKMKWSSVNLKEDLSDLQSGYKEIKKQTKKYFKK